MKNTETINIRGTINALEVAETVVLPRALCVLSSVRNIAAAISADTGKTFSVSVKVDPKNIVVTRKS